MKLVLRDYIESLKEDGELDQLISELLLNMAILPLIKPQKGRQHGVDLAAVGHDPSDKQRKVFLFAIKKGNIDRSTWDGSTNAIRPTLNEIIDNYIVTCIPEIYKSLPIKIIVSSNGLIDSNVNQDWTLFINKNSKGNISFDFWGIDYITLRAEEYLFNEKMFSQTTQALLKRTLVFLEVPDYDLNHFYKLISNIYEGLNTSKKKIDRKNLMRIRMVNLCLNIVYQRGKEINNLKPVINASERVLLITWGILSKNGLLNKDYIREYHNILLVKEQIDYDYFSKTRKHFHIEEGLYDSRVCNHVEYGLITFEQIGIISSIGLYHLNFCEILTRLPDEDLIINAEKHYHDAEVVSQDLVQLIKNNPSAFHPLLDEHLIEINSALTLLLFTEKEKEAVMWIDGMVNNLLHQLKIHKTHPQFETNYEHLFEYHFSGRKQEITSSMLFVLLAEWALILKKPALYNKIVKRIEDDFKDINLQIWFPEKETEESFYFGHDALHTGSMKHSIKLYQNHLEYELEMSEERNMFNVEKDFSFINNAFNIIGYWAFRHYRINPFPNFWRNFLNNKFCFNPKTEELSTAQPK